MTSLPVPVSPVIKTVAFVGATASTSASTGRRPPWQPTIVWRNDGRVRSGSRRIGSFGRYRVVLIDSARSVDLCEQTPFHSRPLLEMSRFDVLPPGQQLYFLVRRRIRATPHFEEWDRVVSKCFSWSFSRKVPISRVTHSRDLVHLGSRPRTDDPSFFMRK